MPKAQLVELYARGLGVIDEARVDFGPGFNVLTGETGAGKTLLLGALELCLGGDAGASRYAVGPQSRAVALFVLDGAVELQFSRESSPTGRLRAALDGVPSSAEVLRHNARRVIVIHGQHESLALRSRAEILRIIDAAGDVDTSELDEVRREKAHLLSEITSWGGDGASRERERGFLMFQSQELTQAELRDPHELSAVLEELTRLSAMRDAQSELLSVVEELDGEADEAILTTMAQAISRLPRDAGVDDLRDDMSALLASVRATVHELRTRTQPEAFDPALIAGLELRAALLQQVARKYGGSLESAILQRDSLLERLEQLENAQGRLTSLETQVLDLAHKDFELSEKVRAQRYAAGLILTSRVQQQLPRVALAHATVRFVVDGPDGSDVQFLFTPNPGWPEGPLQSLASGGELSRVLLALSLETAHDDVVAVFDEVDAGVGGEVAQQIGECLREVGESQQVIAVTHLASVAAKAAHHFVIEKTVGEGTTSTVVREVTGERRVREIARMLAGDSLSDEATALARRLLDARA